MGGPEFCPITMRILNKTPVAARVPDPISAATEHRLIEAAGEVFAEHGFRAATIRDICKRAKANIAAVNYHFGDKEQLYEAVLRYAHQCAAEQYPVQSGVGTEEAEKRLRNYVHSLMCRMLDRGRPAWHGKLMAREMAEPTAALDSLVEASIRPQFDMLNHIVQDILGPGFDDQAIRYAAASVVGQCTFYRHAQSVVTRLHPAQTFEPADIEQLADHIAKFSLAALRAIRAAGHPPGADPTKDSLALDSRKIPVTPAAEPGR